MNVLFVYRPQWEYIQEVRVRSILDWKGADQNPTWTQWIPKDTLLDWQGMEALSVEYDSCSLRSKEVDPVYIMGEPPVLQRHTPSYSWELQSRRLVSQLTLLVNGAATSGRVSQPNKIVIGELLGNSLIWPEGTETVFYLAVNTTNCREGDGNILFSGGTKQYMCTLWNQSLDFLFFFSSTQSKIYGRSELSQSK